MRRAVPAILAGVLLFPLSSESRWAPGGARMNWVTLTSRGTTALPDGLSLVFEGEATERWTLRATVEGNAAATFPAIPEQPIAVESLEHFSFLALDRDVVILTLLERTRGRRVRIRLPLAQSAAGEPARVIVPSLSLCDPPSGWVPLPVVIAGDPTAGDAAPIALRVVDTGGRAVRSWIPYPLPAGKAVILWDGRDDAGRRVPAGAYELLVRDATGGVLDRERAEVN